MAKRKTKYVAAEAFARPPPRRVPRRPRGWETAVDRVATMLVAIGEEQRQKSIIDRTGAMRIPPISPKLTRRLVRGLVTEALKVMAKNAYSDFTLTDPYAREMLLLAVHASKTERLTGIPSRTLFESLSRRMMDYVKTNSEVS